MKSLVWYLSVKCSFNQQNHTANSIEMITRFKLKIFSDFHRLERERMRTN